MQPLSLSDLLELNTFNGSCASVVSPDGKLIAFEVGRPLSRSILGTNSQGSQCEEYDIYLAELDKAGGARELISNSTVSPKTQTYSPAWSPEGSKLAFILLEYANNDAELVPYLLSSYVAVWCREKQTTTKIAKISVKSRHFGKEVYRWLDESKILIKHPGGEQNMEFDNLSSPAERTLTRIRLARFNIEPTAAVYDSKQVNASALPVVPTACISTFDTDTPLQPLQSFESSQARQVFEMVVSPSRARYIIPTLAEVSSHKANESFFSCFNLGEMDTHTGTQVVDIAPYQASILSTLWSQDSNALWMKLVNFYERYFCIGKISYSSGEFDIYGRTVFTYNSTIEYVDELIECEGKIYFPASSSDTESTHDVDWFRFDPESHEYKNLSADCDTIPARLAQCGASTFLACSEGNFFRYELDSDKFTQTRLFPGTLNSQGSDIQPYYQMYWPKARYYNSRFIACSDNRSYFSLVRKTVGTTFEYLLTTDGHVYDSIGIPSGVRPLALSRNLSGVEVVGLKTHRHGNDIISISSSSVKVLGHFNVLLENRRQAETKFFSVGEGQKRIYCEMLLPVNPSSINNHATVVFIYPTSQFTPHDDVYAHNSNIPLFLNPHVFATNGYGVLFAGLPVDADTLKSNDVFAEYSNIINQGIDKAADLGFVNKDRLFILGHSWGGYAAAGLLGHMKEFLGCIASAGAYNSIGEYGVFDEDMKGNSITSEPRSCKLSRNTVSSSMHPWEVPQHYLNSSPLFTVAKIETPLLMIHGEQDYYVRSYQAQQMYTALMLQGKPVRLVTYGGEGHLISARHNISHAWETMLGFLSEHDENSGH